MRDYTVYSLHKNEVEGIFSEAEDTRPEFFSRESLLLYRDRGRHGFTIAPIDAPVAYVDCSYLVTGQTFSLSIESDMCSVLVRAGQTRRAQTVAILQTDAADAIRTVIDNDASRLGTRVADVAPYGWCSWYYRFFNVDETDVNGVLDYYAAHPEIPTPQYVQIDEGWEWHWGDWRSNDKFPSGIEGFVNRARAVGTTPGLWVVPTWIQEALPLFDEHPDWFARYPDGRLAVPHNWLDGPCWGLDITHPEARAFAVGCLSALYDKGIRYFKLDSNLFYTNGHTSYDPTVTTLEATRALYAAYRAALPEAHINSCTINLCRGVIGYIDSCRIAADVDRDWNTRPEKITAYHQMSSCAIKAYANGVLFYNDPDVLYFMGEARLSEMQRRLWLSFVGLQGGTVGHSEIASTLLTHPDEQALVWPPSRERALPVYPCTVAEGQRFGFVARRPFGDFGVFLLWNDTDAPFYADLSPVLSALGESFHVYSLWERRYLGKLGADALLPLARGEGGVYRFTPAASSCAPLLIGSTLHLSMGANEVLSVSDDGTCVAVSLGCDGAREGTLVFYSERPIRRAVGTDCKVGLARVSDGIWEVQIAERAREGGTVYLTYGKQ